MSRFFSLWIVLASIAAVVTYAVGLVAFRQLDVTFTQFAILLIAPAVQAAVLTWPEGTAARLSAALAAARRHPLATPVLLLDGVLLVGGVIWWSSFTLGFGAPVTAQSTWIGVKALVATGVCILAIRGVPVGHRVVFVIVLLLAAAQAFGEGLERVYQLFDVRAQALPEVVVRLLFFGTVFASAVAALLRVSRTLPDHASVWVTTAIALAVPAVLLVVLSFFNHPGVLAPWRGLALVCTSASVTALVLCVLTPASGEDAQS